MTKMQKTIPGKYCVIPRVLILPFDADGRVLLIRGAATKKIWANLWNGPGGHVEAGETPLEAARRELKEETGLVAEEWLLAGEVVIDNGEYQGIVFWVFKAQGVSGELIGSEEGIPVWWTMDEALVLELVEDLYALLPHVAGLTSKDKMFWGSYQYDAEDQLIMRFNR